MRDTHVRSPITGLSITVARSTGMSYPRISTYVLRILKNFAEYSHVQIHGAACSD